MIALVGLLAGSLALALLAGGVAAWLPLAAVVVGWGIWTAGDHQIRDLLDDDRDD